MVAGEVAIQLRRLGHDVLAVQDAEQRWASGLDNPDQIAIAAQQKRVLVTYNIRDFIALSQLWAQARRQHYGILLVHPQTIPQDDIGRRLAQALDAQPADDALLDQVLFLT